MFGDLLDAMERFQREFDKSFSDFFGVESYKSLPEYSGKKGNLALKSPLTDLEETEKEIIAKFDLPGVEKKDIQLNTLENRIEVRVEKKQESKEEKKGFYREERNYRGFYRAMTLPSEIIPEKEKVKAVYKNGVLEVTMQKAENKKKNQIEIE